MYKDIVSAVLECRPVSSPLEISSFQYHHHTVYAPTMTQLQKIIDPSHTNDIFFRNEDLNAVVERKAHADWGDVSGPTAML